MRRKQRCGVPGGRVARLEVAVAIGQDRKPSGLVVAHHDEGGIVGDPTSDLAHPAVDEAKPLVEERA